MEQKAARPHEQVSNEANQEYRVILQLALEIESQANSAQRDINIVKSAISSKQRDARMLEITSTELKQLDRDIKLYEGVGKMFIFTPTETVQKKLASSIAEIKSDVGTLNKKLHYLETTHKNSREHIEKIIGSSGKV
ncbi:MAG: hypothetical protein Q9217_006337 [Psora testacea]